MSSRERGTVLRKGSIAAAVLGLTSWSCDKQGNAPPSAAVAYTSVDQVFSEPIFRHCEQRGGLKVRGLFDTEEAKSTGVLNRLLAESKHPQADLFWSGDPVRPFTLIARGLVESYQPPSAALLPSSLRDERGIWTGFAARARVLLVNTDLVSTEKTPTSLNAMTAPQWKGKVAMANPLFGTTTMHAAALHSVWGRAKTERFFEELKKNEVRVASSNGEVKRLVSSGEVAFGLTDTDDAHEAVRSGAPVTMVYPDQERFGTLLMPTVAVLLKGAPHPEAGKRLMDCLVSAEVEERLAKSGAHMPLRSGVAVPKDLRTFDSVKAMAVDYAAVAETMQEIEPWLRQWVGL